MRERLSWTISYESFCHLRTVALREYAGYNGKKHQNQVLHDKAAYGEMDIYVQIAVYKVCGEFHNHGIVNSVIMLLHAVSDTDNATSPLASHGENVG